MTTRTKGRLAAVVILLLATGVSLIFMMRGGAWSKTAQNSPVGETFQAPSTEKTVGAPVGGGSGGPVQDLVSLAEQAVFTRVNRETGELEYRMTWDSLDPQEGGVFLLTKPRAWIYERGRTIEVIANQGRLRWPSRESEPESGLLEGDVQIIARERIGPPRESDSDGDELLRVRTATLNFHSTLGELRTNDLVNIVGSGSTVTGKGLTIRFSQEKARPLTLFRIEEGGRFEHTPERKGTDARRADVPSRPDQSDRLASAPQPGSGVEAFYRAQFFGGVRMSTREQTIESEQAVAFAKLVDGRIRPDAVGGWKSEPASSAAPASMRPRTKADSPSGAPAESFILEWSGPMEARAILDAPSELSSDDLFLRLESPTGSAIRMTDANSGGIVRCVSLEYGATRRALTMFGRGPIGVTVRAPDVAELDTGRFELDLTTGVGAFPGPGVARAIGAAAAVDDPAFERGQRPRDIRWQDRADFLFDTSAGPVGAGGILLPSELLLRGRVEAREGKATLTADFVKTVFSKGGSLGNAASELAVTRLITEGNAQAEDGSGGRITADAMDVVFEPRGDSGRIVPVLAGARGNVRAERPGETMRAGMVDATLRADDEGRVSIASVDARLGVETRITRTEPGASEPTILEARGERLRGDLETGTLELQGTPAVLGRSRGDETATVSGSSMRFVDLAAQRGLTVFGAGTATHTSLGTSSGPAVRAEIEWESSLIYDDQTGRAEAIGKVRGAAEIGDSDRHTLSGDRLTIDLLPDASGKREFSRALVEGNDESTPAEIELRRFRKSRAADEVAPHLEALAFLRGPAVELDAVARRISTPGAGTLLLEDRRETQQKASRDPAPMERQFGRGTTVFDWKGDMWLSRQSGEGEMTRGVRVRHRHHASTDITDMECEKLRITLADAPATESAEQLSLRRAEAVGAVFVRHGALQMTADHLEYDAARGVIIVSAAPGNRVTVFDESKGRHFVAEAAELNLESGGWKATKVSGQMLGR